MEDKRLIEQHEIEALKASGYRVEDLNDNPHGAQVRGPNWKVFEPHGRVIGYKWLAVDAWVLARDHAQFAGSFASPALPRD